MPTHTHIKKYTARFIESSLSTRPGNRDLLAAVYVYHDELYTVREARLHGRITTMFV